ISGSRIEVIDDSGHAPHLERPDSVTSVVTDFLATTGEPGSFHRACADQLLTTTRAVRKRRDLPRPVPPALVGEGSHTALAAPTMYGSVMPAAWSFMLAARARGLGTAWTTAHLVQEREAAALLGIPAQWKQAVLIPLAFTSGDRFLAAPRRDVDAVTHWNAW